MELVESRLQKVLSAIVAEADIGRIAAETLKFDRRVVVSGLGGSARGLFVAALWSRLRRPLILVCRDPSETSDLSGDVRFFHSELSEAAPERVVDFPAWDVDVYSGLAPHPDIARSRATALWQLRSERVDVVVTSHRALGIRVPDPARFESYGLRLAVGDELSPELLLEHITIAGYVRAEPVGAVGEFSQRGGIVDVFSPGMQYPARIEFFGDTVDSIREFDPDEQRSIQPRKRIEILPMQEHFLTGEMLRKWAGWARRRWGEDRYRTDLNDKLRLADEGLPFPDAACLLSELYPLESTLLDYVEGGIVVFDEAELGKEAYATHYDRAEQRQRLVLEGGSPAVPAGHVYLSPEALAGELDKHPSLDLEQLGAEGSGFAVITQPARRFHGRLREMVETLERAREEDRQVVLLGSTRGMAERFRDLLRDYQIPCFTDFEDLPVRGRPEGRVPIVGVGRISSGFRVPRIGLEVLAETDILDEVAHAAPRGRRRSAAFLSDLESLKIGDYLVHIDHGIGRYAGIHTIHGQECMVLTYQDGDRLYVPLERLDLVQKHSLVEGHHARLDRLGGTGWAQRKARARKAIRDMADELLRLYAERKIAVGHEFGPDTEWQKEFEEAFPFEETPDQVTSIAEIKRDMESPTPMDRLVCGDVGYGKTEVAMRAAFKAVSDGKQVAVLAPTTVLCFQHYETFKERFAAFPVTVSMLSRFVPAKEQKQVVQNLAHGKVDILVGTHRLLSKDVEFSDLGLLIVDEEQRFGVAHKERLKQLKKQVDVLTMTATPIPRTLHMALTGLRDMSVIETPPRDRLAIHTSVVKFSPAVIESAVNFELDRSGQVYVLHNRVESIHSLASFVGKICPRARVGVAHGQMGERELERIMLRFMHHEFDVLVCTTIIENGLDIPLANTMIVNRADRFGLAQLYQLRGRVGRSNRRAYAYLLIPSDQALTPIARRRLAAIREFSELGAGFRLAALDLELRGAGNLLGGEQHGHIEAVGFDLYCQMVEATMEELRTGEAPPEIETSVNLGADLKIPEQFVSDQSVRLRLYKSIASARSEPDIAARRRELEDRFGHLPRAVENLLEYARLRSVGRRMGIASIDRKGDRIDLAFGPNARVDSERVLALVANGEEVRFAPPSTLRVRLRPGVSVFEPIREVLEQLS